MRATELIRKKRDGGELSREDFAQLIGGLMRGEVADYQASALLMAIFLRGLNERETADLTEAMLRSGRVLDLSNIRLPKVDKHSTGGVGDKTSLIIAPIAAAGGLAVPMISGRGLGHTGGTLDKLDSIPGFNTRLGIDEFLRVLARTGAALIGQTDDLAPADRTLYALRDVTATVESIPLISASIMSKKLAEGIDALALDVKTGSGAFMKTREQSRALAERMASIGAAHHTRVQALVTDMSQPLGAAVGNALEVIECIETLKGRGPARLLEVSRELTAVMFLLGGIESSMGEAQRRFDRILASGNGLEKFAEIIEAQGGKARIVDDYSLLPAARHQEPFVSRQSGFIAGIEAQTVGFAAMALGAGRERLDSVIDPAVGIVFRKAVGDPIAAGEPICALFWNDGSKLESARALLEQAITIAPERAAPLPVILERIPNDVPGGIS